jgi:hypothetical protein
MTGAIAVTNVSPPSTSCDVAGIMLMLLVTAPEVRSEEFHSGIYEKN